MTLRLNFLQNAMNLWFPTPIPDDDESFERALMDAVLRSQPHRLEALLAAKPSYDVRSYVSQTAKLTLLHMASSTGSCDCVGVLLRRGADINALEKSGSSPLHLASRNGHKLVVQLLVNNGADIHRSNHEGFTALHWVASNGHLEVARFFLDHGSKLDVLDNNGYTPIHMSCQNGHVEVVKLLIERGASVHVPDRQSRSPLFFACRYGQTECVKTLIKAGAQPSSDEKNETPLHWAIAGNYRDCSDLLLKQFPLLARKLPLIAASAAIEESVIIKVYQQLCLDGHLRTIMISLAEYAATTGQSLLCLNPEVSQLETTFLRLMRIFTRLVEAWQTAHTKGKHKAQDNGLQPPRKTHHRKLSPVLPITTDEINGSSNNAGSSSLNGPPARDSVEDSLNYSDTTDSTPSVFVAVMDSTSSSAESTSLSQTKSQLDVNEPSASQARKGKAPDRINSDDSGTSLSSSSNAALKSAAPPGIDVDALLNGFDDHSSPAHHEQNVDLIGSDIITQAFEELEPLWAAMDSWFSFLQSPQTEDHLPLYLDKLAAIVHGFYLCCACRDHENPPARFSALIRKHDSVLKAFILQQPTILFRQFHFMLDHVDLMAPFIEYVRAQPFETRRQWFYENLSNNHPEPLYDNLTSFLLVSRSSVLENTCEQLSTINIDTLKQSLNVRFHGESGQGAGVRREWFDILTKEILNPNYALFTASADGSTVQPNPDSYINPDHLNFFRFAGRVIGLALFHRQVLDVYFTRSFYKHILGLPVSYKDVESINPQYHNSLQWILDNNISEAGLDMTFSVDDNSFGYTTSFELKPGGAKIPVTEENKREFVQCVAERIMTSAISHQITAFLEGFHEIVPHSLVAMFDEFELELLFSGLPHIDLNDWQANTLYTGFSLHDPQIEWFWELVAEFSHQDKVLLLQFVTGSSGVPMGGFANLMGSEGPMKFTIQKLDGSLDRLPTASTCFNLLKFPPYPTKELLKQRLMVALHYGSKGFEFA